jgi:hypothetical protein
MKKPLLTGLLASVLFIAFQSDAADQDARTKVDFPAMMKTHMLGNMRDHLSALHEIQTALAQGEFEKAGDIAEQRIGMSSLVSHNAAHMAPFMPKGMQAIGTEMHHAASRFALIAKEGDLVKSLDALTKVTQQCVACHTTYRVN